jgi:hypothetical protein
MACFGREILLLELKRDGAAAGLLEAALQVAAQQGAASRG